MDLLMAVMVVQVLIRARVVLDLRKQKITLLTAGFLPLSILRIGISALGRILMGIIPLLMAILTIGTTLTRIDLIIITNAIKEVTPVTPRITDLVDLIIDKDRQITTPLGGTGIGKTIILRTEGFIHKKAGHKVLPWIETRCQEEMKTDHHLLDPLTDKQTQEGIGVDQTTLTLKTQGSTHKRIGHMPILLRETLGHGEKVVCLNLLHPHTHNLKIA
jgi:hypothetical protein